MANNILIKSYVIPFSIFSVVLIIVIALKQLQIKQEKIERRFTI